MNRIQSFDLLRGVAALLVMFGHLRSIFFDSFHEIPYPTVFDRIFYFLTGYGHECVIIFFVLSGYFVGGAFVRNFTSENVRGHVLKYSLNRITRLWVVLIPALVLTFLLDITGRWLTTIPDIYQDTNFFAFIHPSNDISFKVFAGNILFLQTILVPTFGSNTPLWSLANEFWYYLLFPFLFLMWHPDIPLRKKVVLFLIGSVICLFLHIYNNSIMEGFLIWIMGFLIFLLIPRIRLSKLIASCFVLIFIGVMTLIRSGGFPYQDLVLGVSTGLLLIAISNFNFSFVRLPGEFVSKISYTLYLVHLPIIIFIKALFSPHHNLKTSFTGYASFILLTLIVLAASFLMYWLFERRTEVAKKFITQRLKLSKAF